MRSLIDQEIKSYQEAVAQGQQMAPWTFLKNMVNAEKFFNQKKEEPKKDQKAADKKEEKP